MLRRLDLRIDDDDRIALLGANGNGKSTFAKLLAGRLAPMSGAHHARRQARRSPISPSTSSTSSNPDASAYDHVRELMPDAPEAKVRARAGAIGFPAPWPTRRRQALGRREGAAAARARDLRRAASADPRRADQPSRHRQPRGAGRGAQRLSRRGDPDHPRPPSDRGLRRPAVAGRRRHGRRRSMATSTTTGAWCWASAAPARRRCRPRRTARAARANRTDLRRAAAEKRVELAPLRRRIAEAEAAVETAQRGHRAHRCGAGGAGAVCPRSRQGRGAREGARRSGRCMARAEETGLPPAAEFEAAMA